jgi:hypothetical protein
MSGSIQTGTWIKTPQTKQWLLLAAWPVRSWPTRSPSTPTLYASLGWRFRSPSRSQYRCLVVQTGSLVSHPSGITTTTVRPPRGASECNMKKPYQFSRPSRVFPQFEKQIALHRVHPNLKTELRTREKFQNENDGLWSGLMGSTRI